MLDGLTPLDASRAQQHVLSNTFVVAGSAVDRAGRSMKDVRTNNGHGITAVMRHVHAAALVAGIISVSAVCASSSDKIRRASRLRTRIQQGERSYSRMRRAG